MLAQLEALGAQRSGIIAKIAAASALFRQALMAQAQTTADRVYASAVAADAFARSVLSANGVPAAVPGGRINSPL